MKYPTLRISRPQVKQRPQFVDEVAMRQPLNYQILYNNNGSVPKSAPLPRKVYTNNKFNTDTNGNNGTIGNSTNSIRGFSKLQRLMNRHGKHRSRTISRENLAVSEMETNGFEPANHGFTNGFANGHSHTNGHGSSDNSDYGELRAIVRRIEMRQQRQNKNNNFASNTLPSLKSPNSARKRLVFDYVPQSVMMQKKR